MFRDVLYQNISESVLKRVLGSVFRLQSFLMTALEKQNSKRASKQGWLSDKQLRALIQHRFPNEESRLSKHSTLDFFGLLFFFNNNSFDMIEE